MQNSEFRTQAALPGWTSFCILNSAFQSLLTTVRRTYQRVVSTERTTQVYVSGERVGFFAVHENLNAPCCRKVRAHGVDDRVNSQELVQRSARMSTDDVAAEIHERIAAFGDIERAQHRPFRDHVDIGLGRSL